MREWWPVSSQTAARGCSQPKVQRRHRASSTPGSPSPWQPPSWSPLALPFELRQTQLGPLLPVEEEKGYCVLWMDYMKHITLKSHETHSVFMSSWLSVSALKSQMTMSFLNFSVKIVALNDQYISMYASKSNLKLQQLFTELIVFFDLLLTIFIVKSSWE